jgi:hypothetical protein
MFLKGDFGGMFQRYVAGRDTSSKRVAKSRFWRHDLTVGGPTLQEVGGPFATQFPSNVPMPAQAVSSSTLLRDGYVDLAAAAALRVAGPRLSQGFSDNKEGRS